MDSTAVILIILAIVFMLSLMYLCCWWYCTQRRCCGSSKKKNMVKGPAYTRADSFQPEKEAPYISSSTTNNNNAPGILYKTSLSEVDSGKVKYPTAPAPDEAPKVPTGLSIRQPSLMETVYSLRGSAPRSSTAELKNQNTAPPSPPTTEKKYSTGTTLLSYTPNPTTTTITKERYYQPLIGYDRKFSSFGTESKIPLLNSTVTSTIAERKSSLLSERSEPWFTDKRSVSPRPSSPFDASSRMSTNSNSEYSKYTVIRASNPNITTVKKIEPSGGDDDEQTVTIKVKADEADKVSYILSNAVRSGELSSAEAVTSGKTVDVKKMKEKYEHGKTGESTVDGSSSTVHILNSGSDLKSVGLVSSERIPSIITTTASAVEDGASDLKGMMEEVITSIEESAPHLTIQKTVITSSKQEGQITETTMSSRESSTSLKESS